MTNLSVVNYIERINRTYRLIRMESTGCLSELAAKVRVSERTISNYLEELRLMGAEIKFSRVRNTYYFDNRFVLYATFEARIEAEVLNDSEEHLVCNYNKSLKTINYEKSKILIVGGIDGNVCWLPE